mmetsp:Transcript_14467/g.60949  ORF Transcript_14467/g.60949 Transcript_14467/m.60949 type:complete len:216 (-) Transcript_14467:884-1531(-)
MLRSFLPSPASRHAPAPAPRSARPRAARGASTRRRRSTSRHRRAGRDERDVSKPKTPRRRDVEIGSRSKSRRRRLRRESENRRSVCRRAPSPRRVRTPRVVSGTDPAARRTSVHLCVLARMTGYRLWFPGTDRSDAPRTESSDREVARFATSHLSTAETAPRPTRSGTSARVGVSRTSARGNTPPSAVQTARTRRGHFVRSSFLFFSLVPLRSQP